MYVGKYLSAKVQISTLATFSSFSVLAVEKEKKKLVSLRQAPFYNKLATG